MNDLKVLEADTSKEAKRLRELLDLKLKSVGNLVHDSVPVSDDEVRLFISGCHILGSLFFLHENMVFLRHNNIDMLG